MPTGQEIVDKAMTQKGKTYIFGYEVRLDDPNPKSFDCSEMVEWVCHQLRVTMPDGARNQFQFCRVRNQEIELVDAYGVPGALLFRISDAGDHVAISQGVKKGGTWKTIEAKGKAWGVVEGEAARPGFTHAALIPGVDYGPEWEDA